MLRKSLLVLSTSVMLAIAGSTAPVHAFGPPPPPGGGFHPGPALGGLPRFGGVPHFAGPHGFGGVPRFAGVNRFAGSPHFYNGVRGNLGSFRGGSSRIGGRAAVYNTYGGRQGWRHGYWGRHGVYAYGGNSYSSSDASSDHGCYYAERYSSKYHTYRRALICG